MSFINKQELLAVLKENSSRFLSGPGLLRQALVDARDSHYPTVVPGDPPNNTRTQVIISKFEIGCNNDFEVWVEFNVRRQEGTVVGTHVYKFGTDGEATLKETYGTIFQSQSEPVV